MHLSGGRWRSQVQLWKRRLESWGGFSAPLYRYVIQKWQHLSPYLSKLDFLPTFKPQTKDGDEVMQDSCGRWFSFCVTPETVIIMEKKTMPNHLQSLPCVDSPTVLSTILREMEDAGEVRCL